MPYNKYIKTNKANYMNNKTKLLCGTIITFGLGLPIGFSDAYSGKTVVAEATPTAQSSTSGGPKGWNANNSPVNPEASKPSCHGGYACEQPKPSATQLAASRDRNSRSNERRSSVRRQCHAAFKAGMFDPRSFRIDSEWFNELPNDDGTGHIAYIANVSGTNGFGGRVRQNIACIADGSVITDYQF